MRRILTVWPVGSSQGMKHDKVISNLQGKDLTYLSYGNAVCIFRSGSRRSACSKKNRSKQGVAFTRSYLPHIDISRVRHALRIFSSQRRPVILAQVVLHHLHLFWIAPHRTACPSASSITTTARLQHWIWSDVFRSNGRSMKSMLWSTSGDIHLFR